MVSTTQHATKIACRGVKADATANATIEVYAENDGDVDFYLVGYWTTPPADYTERFADIGSPSSDARLSRDQSTSRSTAFGLTPTSVGRPRRRRRAAAARHGFRGASSPAARRALPPPRLLLAVGTSCFKRKN